ncbi:hypothetical protein ACLOJK_008210 [Asimina triloba]
MKPPPTAVHYPVANLREWFPANANSSLPSLVDSIGEEQGAAAAGHGRCWTIREDDGACLSDLASHIEKTTRPMLIAGSWIGLADRPFAGGGFAGSTTRKMEHRNRCSGGSL